MNQYESFKQNTQDPVDTNTQTIPSRIFSGIFQYMKWFSSLRWYIIVLIVTVVLFFIFHLEHSIETRRKKKEKQSQKEGMQMKGIIRDEYTKKDYSGKKVCFANTNNEDNLLEKSNVGSHKKVSTLSESMANVYDLWILPGVYVFFRKFGFV